METQELQAMRKIRICIPIHNDWEAVAELIRRIDKTAHSHGMRVEILIVDDGSTESPPKRMHIQANALADVTVLRLRSNLGHQRAIAIGITYLCRQGLVDPVVIMDGDGEDAPEDIPRLLERYDSFGGTKTVFAKRGRRLEGWAFKSCYLGYKLAHRWLTGRGVEVGNFSIVPPSCVERLVGVSELWNNYSAATFKAKIPVDEIRIDRGRRIHGRSKMNFNNLVVHGLSAMSVHAEAIGGRMLVAAVIFSVLALLGTVSVLVAKVISVQALPPWFALFSSLLVLLVVLSVLTVLLFVFVVLQGRSAATFIPLRDYRHFIFSVDRVTLAP